MPRRQLNLNNFMAVMTYRQCSHDNKNDCADRAINTTIPSPAGCQGDVTQSTILKYSASRPLRGCFDRIAASNAALRARLDLNATYDEPVNQTFLISLSQLSKILVIRSMLRLSATFARTDASCSGKIFRDVFNLFCFILRRRDR